MNSEAECILTGIILYDRVHDVAYHGDLYKMGDTYICNCNEQSAHTLPEDWLFERGRRWVRPPACAWNRGGTWVFHKDDCKMSVAAQDYIA